jgi:hypothetical protein
VTKSEDPLLTDCPDLGVRIVKGGAASLRYAVEITNRLSRNMNKGVIDGPGIMVRL